MKTIKEDIFNTGYGSPYDYEEDYRACDWCEEEFPVSALTKTDGGWVCPQCIEEAESHGEPFTVFSEADYYSELQEAINSARANKSKINKKLRESKALNEKWLIEARTKPWTAEEIKNILYKNDDQVGKALVQLWERQEDDEKASKTTSHKNSSGFNAFDAEILSSFAEFYSTHNRLSPKQLFIARKRIMKYAKQLADIANESNFITSSKVNEAFLEEETPVNNKKSSPSLSSALITLLFPPIRPRKSAFQSIIGYGNWDDKGRVIRDKEHNIPSDRANFVLGLYEKTIKQRKKSINRKILLHCYKIPLVTDDPNEDEFYEQLRSTQVADIQSDEVYPGPNLAPLVKRIKQEYPGIHAIDYSNKNWRDEFPDLAQAYEEERARWAREDERRAEINKRRGMRYHKGEKPHPAQRKLEASLRELEYAGLWQPGQPIKIGDQWYQLKKVKKGIPTSGEVKESLNESTSIEDYLARVLMGYASAPMDLDYISQNENSGSIQFNGVIYGYLKNEDGTYSILSPISAPIQEDFVNDGVNRKVKTPQEIEKELSELSNNFTEQDIMLRTELEDEKTLAANILKKHYSTVEISDGRTTKEERMSWVVTAVGPFKDFAEDYDDNIGDYLKEEIQLNESDVEFIERYKNHGIYFVDNKYTWESSDFTYLTDTSLEGLKAQIDEYDEQYNHYFHNLYEAK